MSDNLHSIFSGSECPPHSRLADYLSRNLTEEEMHGVEKHLIDCEMCSDELEGLSKMKDPRDLEGLVSEINERTFAGKGRILGLRRNYALMAAAAVILLLVGSVMILRVVTSSRQETTMTVTTESSLSTQDLAPETPALSQLPAADKKVQTEPAPAVQDMQLEPSPVAGVTSGEAETSGLEAVQESKDQRTPGYTTVPADSEQPTRDEIAPEATARNSIVAEGISVEKMATKAKAAELSGKPDSSTLMDIGMQEFRAGNYTQAALFFSQLTANDTANREADYHLALCYYYTGETKKAIRILKSIGRDTLNPYLAPANELLEKINRDGDH
jgi:hypothetical protein